MKFLKGLVFFLVALLAILAIGGFFLPKTWQAQRSVVINAAPADIQPYLDTLKKWPEWIPWTTESDPSLVYTYEGPESGVGAKQLWTSNKMGHGWLLITNSDPTQGISFDMEMGEGAMHASGTMSYQVADAGTTLTWKDTGELGNNIIKRYFGLFIGPMVGADMDKGLAKLKQLVEKQVAAAQPIK